MLDRNARRAAAGRVLLGGEPFRVLRLGERGAAVLDSLLSRESTAQGAPDTLSPAEQGLVSRLVEAGLLHPVPTPDPCSGSRILVVVPVRHPPPSLAHLVETLRRDDLAVCLVDDGSDDGGAATRRFAERTGATPIVRAESGGPAAARNAARPLAAGHDLVAFLDADVVLAADGGGDPLDWLWRCVGHFCDEEVALVAPRVSSSVPGMAARAAGRLGAYEATESPLDLGPDAGLVGVGRRLSYVPAAALVARREALEQVGWFDESLRYGEDVDLVRRIGEGGWRCRYEPAALVGHPARQGPLAFVRQRFGYGSSAAALERRHPGTVAPFAAPPVMAAAACAALCAVAAGPRTRRAGALASLAAGAYVVRRLSAALGAAGCPDPRSLAVRLTARSVVASAGGLLTAFRRAWWPLTLPLWLVPRVRRRLALLALCSVVAGHGGRLWAGGPARGGGMGGGGPAGCSEGLAEAIAHVGIGAADDLAYSAGVWWGCARERSIRALYPRLGRIRPTRTVPRGG